MYYYSSCADGHRGCLQMSKWQSHLNKEPSANVKIEVIPHFFIPQLRQQFLIVLGGVSYTCMAGCDFEMDMSERVHFKVL